MDLLVVRPYFLFISLMCCFNELEMPPKRKIVFIINPFGGKGTARQIWEKVKTLLEIANVEAEVIGNLLTCYFWQYKPTNHFNFPNYRN